MAVILKAINGEKKKAATAKGLLIHCKHDHSYSLKALTSVGLKSDADLIHSRRCL